MASIRLGSARARRGEKAWGQMRVRHNGREVRLPVVVVHGAKAGEHVVLLANQHGNEVNGVEAQRRFCEWVQPRQVQGTIFAVLSANPRAALNGTATWFEDATESRGDYRSRYNMNWIWPGREDGLLIERVVHELWTRAILAPHARAGLVVDMHCHQNTTAVYAEDDKTLRLGVASGIQTIIRTRSLEVYRERSRDEVKARCVSYACDGESIPCLVVELHGQNAMVPASIDEGVKALRNVLRFAGMLPGRLDLPPRTIILDPWRVSPGKNGSSESYAPCRAQHAGLFVPYKNAYETVAGNERIGAVMDVHTGRHVQECRAGIAGAVYHIPLKSACARGDRLIDIAGARTVQARTYLHHEGAGS